MCKTEWKILRHCGGTMIDATEEEIFAAQNAGVIAGEYLESIKKYDLSRITQAEWQQFVLILIDSYQRLLAEQLEKNNQVLLP